MTLSSLIPKYFKALDRRRRAKYGAVPIKVLTGAQIPYTEQASYTDGWDLEHIEDVPQNQDFFKLFIMDLDGTRTAKLTAATAFAISGYVYKRLAIDPPKDVVPLWEYRLQPTGQRI